MTEIDFVVTWVNCNDLAWQEKYSFYKGNKLKLEGEEGARYRENNMFKYWFRAVEKYAPWVRKIHLITDNQAPLWLNVFHEKLNLVSHTDYIPQEYLPTFNSNVIEININRIKDLSEKFVLFNDDFFLNGAVDPNFYFKNNIPCDSLILKPLAPWSMDSIQFTSIVLLNTTIINKNFSLKKFVKNYPNKIFSLKYSSKILKNYFYYKNNKFYIGFDNPHLPQPFLKSTLNKVWSVESWELIATSQNKFRTSTDVSQYLFRYWQLVTGSFVPVKPKSRGKYLDISLKNVDEIIKKLNDESCKQLCLNDSTNLDSFYVLNRIVQKLEEKFPKKSTFEI